MSLERSFFEDSVPMAPDSDERLCLLSVHEPLGEQGDKPRSTRCTLPDVDEETRHRITAIIQNMCRSTDLTERADGERLQVMLRSNDRRDKHLAIQIIDILTEPDLRHKMLAILHDPRWGGANCDSERRGTARILTGMLLAPLYTDSPFPDSTMAVARLLVRLTSSESTERQDGERLLNRLNSSSQQNDARRILEFFALNPGPLKQLLDLMHGSRQQQTTAQTIIELIKNEKINKVQATNLISLLSSTDTTQQQDAQTLLNMLGNNERSIGSVSVEEQRTVAGNILSNIADHKQVHQMLDLLRKPELKTASEQVLKMLESESTVPAAMAFLELLNSKSPLDRADGEQILKILNSSDEGERRSSNLSLSTPSGQHPKLTLAIIMIDFHPRNADYC